MDRVAIFIDGAYLDYELRDEFGGARIDYSLLARRLAGRMQSFVNQLTRLPRFKVRLGKLAFRGLGGDGRPIFVQKRVDIMLGVDLVLLSAKGQISNAMLIAGDSDFLPAVQVARDEGVVIHLYYGAKYPPHRELWDACDERTLLTRSTIDSVLRT